MSAAHNPWGMTQGQVLDWAGRGMRAAQAESELRRAVKAMTALLENGEWAEHASQDADAAALELAITKLMADMAAPAAPQGWKLVPIEPTLDMGWAYLDAAREADPHRDHNFSHPGYRAMLSEAPIPQDSAAQEATP